MYTAKTQYQKSAIERAIPIALSLILVLIVGFGILEAVQAFAAVTGELGSTLDQAGQFLAKS